MESEINKLIREVLELFGIATDRVIGEWNLIGHLSNIVAPLEEEILELKVKLAAIEALVDEQAEDDGLWFVAEHASEGYLQQELRRLHRMIEEGK